jgi:ABC-2 type transport system ATP-binding protein
VAEELIFQAQFYGMGAADARRRAEELLQRLDLSGLGGRDVKTLSGGQKRRLDIALGLMHSPELIFLDEPTTGLDPQSRSNMWGHIADLRRTAGTTVFITTHYLDEADALCDRILVIDGGRIIAEGTPDELKRGVSGDLVTITVPSDPDAALVLARRLPGATEPVCEPDGDAYTVTFRVPEGERMIIGLLRDLDAAGVPLSGVSVRRPTLDDVFLTLTGRTLREEAA